MNIQKMMKQAQQMQQKMNELQDSLGDQLFEGQSGGGAVKVTLTGKTEARKVQLDASMLNADDKDMLEDLIVAAFNDAKKKAEDYASDQLGQLTGGMGLPGGLKLPF